MKTRKPRVHWLWGWGAPGALVLAVVLSLTLPDSCMSPGRRLRPAAAAATTNAVATAPSHPVASPSAAPPTPARDPLAVPHILTQTTLAEGLVGPSGLAIHPTRQRIYVAEQDAARISVLEQGRGRPVIDARTPIYADAGRTRRAGPLRAPEGLAISAADELYVTEDCVGGRLLRFDLGGGVAPAEGEVVPLPRAFHRYAWTGVAVGPVGGTLLLAGNDAAMAVQGDAPAIFAGAILYRDEHGDWWSPFQRPLASFSVVRFSSSGRRAVYVSDLSGEVGWLDLRDRQGGVGFLSTTGTGALEGLATLPDGTLLLGRQSGSVLHADPVTDRVVPLVTGLRAVEQVAWDAARGRMLVVEAGRGRVLAFGVSPPLDSGLADRLERAPLEPPRTLWHVPAQCPPFLRDLLHAAGGAARAPYPQLVKRVPLVGADCRTLPLPGSPLAADPLVRLQFLIVAPNRLLDTGAGAPQLNLSTFVAETRSGRTIHTASVTTCWARVVLITQQWQTLGEAVLTIPQAGPVSVGATGLVVSQFLGLGRLPDYSIVLNPANPRESYLMVEPVEGPAQHYRLLSPDARPAAEHWLITYSRPLRQDWLYLGGL